MSWGTAVARATKRLVVCVNKSGNEVSFERRKIYFALPDSRAEKLGQVRVLHESGEDYLYPAKAFVALTLPQAIRRAVLRVA